MMDNHEKLATCNCSRGVEILIRGCLIPVSGWVQTTFGGNTLPNRRRILLGSGLNITMLLKRRLV